MCHKTRKWLKIGLFVFDKWWKRKEKKRKENTIQKKTDTNEKCSSSIINHYLLLSISFCVNMYSICLFGRNTLKLKIMSDNNLSSNTIFRKFLYISK